MNIFQTKRIAIVLGRGIEGCGVTKFTLEQERWFKAQGYEVDVFATSDKKWTRTLSHNTNGWNSLKFSNPSNVDIVYAACKRAEFVIINSLPSKGHPVKCIEGFSELINLVHGSRIPMVLVQHDHSSMSICRNECIGLAIQKATVIFGHSKTNDFATMVEEITGGGGLASFFDDDNSKKIFGFQPGLDFDATRNEYWQCNPDRRDMNHHKWIGRTTSWKGYIQMFKLHNEFLRPAGCVTTFEGIERSPAYLGFRELSEFVGCITDDIADTPLEKDQPAYVFGPYKHAEMLHRMGEVGFGYQLSLLKERFIERSIEYTHCELACTGVIPVFRKSYGERCIHRHYGVPLIECEKTGIIWLDDDDMEPAFMVMRSISGAPRLYSQAAENACEFLKLHQDSQYTFAEMLATIKKEIESC
jgi:hypothetical protein